MNSYGNANDVTHSSRILQQRLRAAQLAGHDINAVIDQITAAPMDRARAQPGDYPRGSPGGDGRQSARQSAHPNPATKGATPMTSAPVRDPIADHLMTPQNAALLLIDYQP